MSVIRKYLVSFSHCYQSVTHCITSTLIAFQDWVLITLTTMLLKFSALKMAVHLNKPSLSISVNTWKWFKNLQKRLSWKVGVYCFPFSFCIHSIFLHWSPCPWRSPLFHLQISPVWNLVFIKIKIRILSVLFYCCSLKHQM